MNSKEFGNINFFNKREIKAVNLFEINKEKILLSIDKKGLIINIKSKQVETYINNYRNIYYMKKSGKWNSIKNLSN